MPTKLFYFSTLYSVAGFSFVIVEAIEKGHDLGSRPRFVPKLSLNAGYGELDADLASRFLPKILTSGSLLSVRDLVYYWLREKWSLIVQMAMSNMDGNVYPIPLTSWNYPLWISKIPTHLDIGLKSVTIQLYLFKTNPEEVLSYPIITLPMRKHSLVG